MPCHCIPSRHTPFGLCGAVLGHKNDSMIPGVLDGLALLRLTGWY